MKNLKKGILGLAVAAFVVAGNISYPVLSEVLSPEEQTNISVYDKVLPSIVDIDADLSDGVSSGAGCIVDSEGIILTSSHVVENSSSIKITLLDGKTYSGKVIGVVAENSDLALIKIKPDSKLTPIKFADSSKLKVGQKVLAIGNPFGFERTLTTGIISRIDKEMNKIQTDAVINPGSSGGPLLNTSGEVVGINQSIYNPDNNRSNIGIGFAVPANTARKFVTVTGNGSTIVSSNK